MALSQRDQFDALIALLAVDSLALQRRVLASDLPARMLTGVRRLGLTGIGIGPSVVAGRAIRALGAVPVESTFNGADLSVPRLPSSLDASPAAGTIPAAVTEHSRDRAWCASIDFATGMGMGHVPDFTWPFIFPAMIDFLLGHPAHPW